MPVIAALQIGSHPDGTQATLNRIQSFMGELKNAGTDVVVLPEATLGGYPKGADFGTKVGFRKPEGRAEFRSYWEQAIAVPGPETDALAELSASVGSTIAIGVIERDGHTLHCAVLFFDPMNGLVAKHRKLMPTGSERLIWGKGDGSTMPAVETSVGRIGAAICWENYMPLFRTEMYSKDLSVWCAPTVDEREIWQKSMAHIAYEARTFLVSACQYVPSPKEFGIEVADWEADRPLIRGGSVVMSPLGEVIAGPLYGEEGLVAAEINLAEIAEARFDLDVNGHYARPDIFTLHVDRREKKNVVAIEDPISVAPSEN
ncbi:carbon-nitrogen hydrolase family protein [Cohaesibacter celericrescens]|uniref:Nitrilase n=1 Tax=Cohaesibacter celericrescens TaxID=2067669 RepID=A0A2N5XNK0_9HYPH|nr:carbon-nitrogen hydrolase family protein [Cohaesibacter celericrescens]PLW76099.1 nitrilase [Cohaesibacter celericrescens]